jgi:hypothetical protein
MPTVIDNLAQLPQGSHCVSFHTTRKEAAQHAVSFLAGAPPGQAASYWVPDSDTAAYYGMWLAREAPDHVGCVAILSREQVEMVDGKLRPIEEIREFVGNHPEGVTGASETITHYWAPENVPAHLEYEAWFQDQPREESRFLCPYDLKKVPPAMAPDVLRELGRHHTHVALSTSLEPGARLLQLFVFPTVDQLPESLDGTLGWAIRKGLVDLHSPSRELSLAQEGSQVVREWSQRTTVDW